MNKDDFAKMQARKEIVAAFISKLEKTEMSDINLIPALMDYVNNGNMSLFNEYNKFHQMTDTEKKANEMEDRLQKANEAVEGMKVQLDSVNKRDKEYRGKISDAIMKYQNWLRETRKATIDENPQVELPNMRDLRDFAQKIIDDSKHGGYQRRLYLKDGDKLKSVTAIMFDGEKAIMEVGSKTTILTPVPEY